MKFITEINNALEEGFDSFKAFILSKQQGDKDYLEHPYWVPDGLQMTVLNYLIHKHQEVTNASPAGDLTVHIDFITKYSTHKNIGLPIHQAIRAGKFLLATHLIEQKVFDIDRMDKEGNTLLSLVLATRNKGLLRALMNNKPNVHETTYLGAERIPYQPIHQAILANFSFGITLLAQAGAQLGNPGGLLMDTPVLLAARLGKIRALEALLENPVEQLYLEAENNDIDAMSGHGDNAIESLCRLFAYDKNNKKLIKGVAMLLCRGAEPPRNEEMHQLLANKRMELLREIDIYLERRPSIVDLFVTRCHLSGTSLHTLIYVDHSWGNALRQLLGRPSAAAFTVESWLTRKYDHPTEENPQHTELPTRAAVTFTGKESPLKLYAEFVRRYKTTYASERFTNPWSTMRWMIAEGQGTWEAVLAYSRNHPASRTRIVINDMIKDTPEKGLHVEIDASIVHSITN